MRLMNHRTRRTVSNDFQIERMKILIQFLIMLLASLLAGGIFTEFLGAEALLTLSQRVSTHFVAPFAGCMGLGDAVGAVVRYSAAELICVVVTFVFSFSVLNYLTSDLILVYRGFTFGFSACLLYRMLMMEHMGYQPGWLRFFIFVGAKGCILLGFFLYSWRAALHSYELKRLNDAGRAIWNTRVMGALILGTLAFCGLILFFNGFYCLLIFVLSK